MFHVSNRDALAMPEELLPPGNAVFTGIEIPLHLAMFLAEYSFLHETDGGPLSTRYLVGGLEKLADPSIECGEATLERVTLMSPPYLNGTGDWKTDVLAWADEAEDPNGCQVELYGLADGRLLWHNPRGLRISALKNRQRVFVAPSHRKASAAAP